MGMPGVGLMIVGGCGFLYSGLTYSRGWYNKPSTYKKETQKTG